MVLIILKSEKGFYVKADRNVLLSKDTLKWEKQVEEYINNKIRKRQNTEIIANDGTSYLITKKTAGKAKYRNEVKCKDGNIRRLNNKEFACKLRAELHIDELVKLSKYKNGPVMDNKNHFFAKDGFIYRTAFFEDFDGKYYRITFSVGVRNSINTVYNIGKIQKWSKK